MPAKRSMKRVSSRSKSMYKPMNYTSQVSGKGAYKKKRKAVRRSQPDNSNQSIGASIGSKVGGFLGDLGQKALSSIITGFGDYAPISLEPKSNSLMQEMDLYGPPSVVNNPGNRSVIVRHREFIGDIVTGAAGAFNLQTFNVNPGLASTFPWLSQMAINFQEWKPLGILFEFRSTSADALNSTNTALGTVVLATDYDATDNVAITFQNKQMMMNHEFSQSAKQSCSILHPLECSPAMNPYSIFHVRNGAEPANADLRLTDLGVFGIATFGQQGSNVTVGELWVTYEIEFLKPQSLNLLGGEVLTYKAFNNNLVSTSNYFGPPSNIVVRSGSVLGMTISSNRLSFPPIIQTGSFLVLYSVNGASTASVIPPSITPTNCSIPLVFSNGVNGSVQAPTPTATATACLLAFVVNITTAGASLLWTGGTLPTGANMDIIVTEYNGFITN